MTFPLPCDNCAAALGPQFALRYTLRVSNPDGSEGALHFKVAKARAMVEADPRPAVTIRGGSLRQFLEEHAEAINTEHLDHIPLVKIGEPGLIVQFDELAADGRSLVPTAVLIDGTHRAARALRDGLAFRAYVLTDAEMAAIVEVENAGYGQVPGTSPDLAATPLGGAPA